MDIFSLLSLSLALLIAAAIPGPGVTAVLARSLASGLRPAVNVILGIIIGDLIFVLFAVFGLSIIAQTLGELFTIVKICGGIYIFILGLGLWFSEDSFCNSKQAVRESSLSGNMISGLLITLSNPKAIIFYCSFLPAFIDLSTITISDVILIMIIVVGVLSIVLITYAYLASQLRKIFSSKKAIKKIKRTAGGIMIATGVTVAAKS